MKFTVPDAAMPPRLIADKITAYLESTHKTVCEDVLVDTTLRMRETIVRDLMSPRNTRVGQESNTLYTGPCARKARLTFDGAEREPLRARTLLKFLLGDLVELSVLAMAKLAGCEIVENNISLAVLCEDGVLVPVHPDGRYVDDQGTPYNIEIKSCDSRTFDKWVAEGGPDDTWGYLTQASMEIEAWRQHGVLMDTTIFLAVSTGSRQGSLAEFHVPYDGALVAGWHTRRQAARQGAPPEIPFQGAPEIQYKAGKTIDPLDFTYGEPVARVNAKGTIYGWDVPTGRTVVPMVCTYCDYRGHQCWQTAVMELDGNKPVWVVPAEVRP